MTGTYPQPGTAYMGTAGMMPGAAASSTYAPPWQGQTPYTGSHGQPVGAEGPNLYSQGYQAPPTPPSSSSAIPAPPSAKAAAKAAAKSGPLPRDPVLPTMMGTSPGTTIPTGYPMPAMYPGFPPVGPAVVLIPEGTSQPGPVRSSSRRRRGEPEMEGDSRMGDQTLQTELQLLRQRVAYMEQQADLFQRQRGENSVHFAPMITTHLVPPPGATAVPPPAAAAQTMPSAAAETSAVPVEVAPDHPPQVATEDGEFRLL